MFLSLTMRYTRPGVREHGDYNMDALSTVVTETTAARSQIFNSLSSHLVSNTRPYIRTVLGFMDIEYYLSKALLS